MATIASIIRNAKGTAGAWRVEREHMHPVGEVAHLHHYGTRMLTWSVARPDDDRALDYGIGWGSVSDQNGMNTAFKVLGLPFYFSRAGGAEVLELCTCGAPAYRHRDGACDLPADWEAFHISAADCAAQGMPADCAGYAVTRDHGSLVVGVGYVSRAQALEVARRTLEASS